MKRQLSNVSSVIGLLLALSVFSVSAHDGNHLHAKLVGTQEVPVVSSLASGDLDLRIESDSDVHFKLTYEGLQGGDTLFAHIHLGQNSVNGGLVTFF